MAYNKNNYYKKCRRMIEIYNAAKDFDVPDTKIIKDVFPKNGIFISYRQWMNIKAMPIPKEINQ